MNRPLFCFCALLSLSVLPANGHPVAQGSMEIAVEPDHIRIIATVSTEEAFVAESLGNNPKAAGLDDVWRRHGDYLLSHLEIVADGQSLPGKVVTYAPLTASEHIRYELRYEVPPSGQPRTPSLTLKQHVLNEFSFAPGNPWEATYVVKIPQAVPPREGDFFTSKEPLTFSYSQFGSGDATARYLDLELIGAFLRHGFRHILGGYDHLLFVAGLVLAVRSLWDLVKVVTAFTFAHTLTLTLAVLDIVRVSNRIVEPMIAASIVFVALQNLVAPEQSRGRLRLAIAFGFGLFHGLGFAGGLLSAMEGMRTGAVASAIVAFSIGVELGHQAVALPLFAAMRLTQRRNLDTVASNGIRLWTLRLGSGAICLAGAAYLIAALRWV
jgi:hypothetical protein